MALLNSEFETSAKIKEFHFHAESDGIIRIHFIPFGQWLQLSGVKVKDLFTQKDFEMKYKWNDLKFLSQLVVMTKGVNKIPIADALKDTVFERGNHMLFNKI